MNDYKIAIASFLTTFTVVGGVIIPRQKVLAQTATDTFTEQQAVVEGSATLQGIEANIESNWQFAEGGDNSTIEQNFVNIYQLRENSASAVQIGEKKPNWGNLGEPKPSSAKIDIRGFLELLEEKNK